MNIYTPYTYLIGWSFLNQWYYGVRFKINCHPSDLFVTYFTSSKHVRAMIDVHGNPDIIQIRKTFTEAHTAKLWETKVLKRMKVINDPKWINKTSNTSWPDKTGHIDSFETNQKRNKSLSQLIWINDGNHNKRIHVDLIIPNNWFKGRITKSTKKSTESSKIAGKMMGTQNKNFVTAFDLKQNIFVKVTKEYYNANREFLCGTTSKRIPNDISADPQHISPPIHNRSFLYMKEF